MLDRITDLLRTWQHALYWLGIPLLAAVIGTLLADYLVAKNKTFNAAEEERLVRLKQFGTPEPNPAIAIIGIGEQTGARLHPSGNVTRDDYATLLRKLRAAGARVVLLDIVFTPPKGKADVELRKALHEPGGTRLTLANVNPLKASEFQEGEPDDQRWEYVDYAFLNVREGNDNLRTAANTHFAPGTDSIGAVLYRYDRDLRRPILHASLSAALQFRGISESEIRFDASQHELSAGGLEWKLQGNDALIVQWTEETSPFPTYDLADVLLTMSTEKCRKSFQGKLVFIGRVDGVDMVQTMHSPMHGVEFLAQTANTILLPPGERVRDLSSFWHTAWCLALGMLGCLAAMSSRGIWTILGAVSLGALAIALPDVTASNLKMAMETVAPAMTLLFCFAAGVAVHAWISTPGRPAGSEFEATAMFVDLRGSTQLLRKLGAQEYRKIYTIFSRRVAETIRRFGGAVERTTGDGALAIFPANRNKQHAVAAAQAIRPMQEALAELSRRLGERLNVAVGIESGVLTGGYVTEGGRRAWSSSGSAVNMARRLQEATDELRTDTAVGPVAARLMEGRVRLKPLGEIEAQGFEGKAEAWGISEGDDK